VSRDGGSQRTPAPWLRPLKKYEPFDRLVTQEQQAAVYGERLSLFSKVLKSWQETASRESAKVLPKGTLLEHPCVGGHSELCGKVVEALLMDETLLLPTAGTVLRSLPVLVPIRKLGNSEGKLHLPGEAAGLQEEGEKAPEVWVVGDRYPVAFLQVHAFYSDSQRTALALIAESLSKGSTANVMQLTSRLLAKADADINALADFRKTLQATILPNAALAVTVQIYNGGGTSVCFKPHFMLKLLPDKGRHFIMAAAGEDRAVREAFEKMLAGIPSAAREAAQQEGGLEAKAPVFLPRSGETSYVTVGPGALQEVRLLASESLGDTASTVKQAYNTGLLACQVLGVTLEGRSVASAPASFGQQVSQPEQEQLIRLIESKP